jgi:hypothetical protein
MRVTDQPHVTLRGAVCSFRAAEDGNRRGLDFKGKNGGEVSLELVGGDCLPSLQPTLPATRKWSEIEMVFPYVTEHSTLLNVAVVA